MKVKCEKTAFKYLGCQFLCNIWAETYSTAYSKGSVYDGDWVVDYAWLTCFYWTSPLTSVREVSQPVQPCNFFLVLAFMDEKSWLERNHNFHLPMITFYHKCEGDDSTCTTLHFFGFGFHGGKILARKKSQFPLANNDNFASPVWGRCPDLYHLLHNLTMCWRRLFLDSRRGEY